MSENFHMCFTEYITYFTFWLGNAATVLTSVKKQFVKSSSLKKESYFCSFIVATLRTGEVKILKWKSSDGTVENVSNFRKKQGLHAFIDKGN